MKCGRYDLLSIQKQESGFVPDRHFQCDVRTPANKMGLDDSSPALHIPLQLWRAWLDNSDGSRNETRWQQMLDA